MARSFCHSPIAGIPVATHKDRQYPCSSNDNDDDEEEEEGVEFEFRPLLLSQTRGAGRAIERPSRTGGRRRVADNVVVTRQRARRAPTSVSAASAKAEQQAGPRRVVRWHHMAFGSVRVPSAMDMGEIRRRLKVRQQQQALQADGGSAHGPSATAAEAEAWAPWRLIRSLSCKGVEAVAVAAVAAPVRLV